MLKRNLAVVASTILTSAAVASAVPVFEDNFDVDTSAAWTVNKGGGNDANQFAEFAYNYAAMGIPSAPNSVGNTTSGLRLRANVAGGIFSGLSVSPTGEDFGSQYTLEADVWGNYIGSTTSGVAVGGSSSTQATTIGVGTAGTSAQWAGTGAYDSVFFGAVNDGGTGTSDYRVYPKANNVTPSSGYYAAGTTNASSANNADPYYDFLEAMQAPTKQQQDFPGTQTGTSPDGIIGFDWHRMKVIKDDTNVRWFIDDVIIATVPLSAVGATGGNNILLGEFDTSAGSGSGTGADQLNFGLFDNVVVTSSAVPEPAALSLLAAAALPLMRRRRTAAK